MVEIGPALEVVRAAIGPLSPGNLLVVAQAQKQHFRQLQQPRIRSRLEQVAREDLGGRHCYRIMAKMAARLYLTP